MSVVAKSEAKAADIRRGDTIIGLNRNFFKLETMPTVPEFTNLVLRTKARPLTVHFNRRLEGDAAKRWLAKRKNSSGNDEYLAKVQEQARRASQAASGKELVEKTCTIVAAQQKQKSKPVGFEVALQEGKLVVTSVELYSPGHTAGLKVGDRVAGFKAGNDQQPTLFAAGTVSAKAFNKKLKKSPRPMDIIIERLVDVTPSTDSVTADLDSFAFDGPKVRLSKLEPALLEPIDEGNEEEKGGRERAENRGPPLDDLGQFLSQNCALEEEEAKEIRERLYNEYNFGSRTVGYLKPLLATRPLPRALIIA